MTQPSSPLPLTRLVVVDEIPPTGLQLTVVATESERAALAAANALDAIASVEAEVLLRHEGRGGVHVGGSVAATVTQTCGVSLDPFEAQIDETLDVHFLPEHALEDERAARRRQPPPAEDENEPDEPDLIQHGRIDVGALVAETLTLGIDPYPRKPGAALDPRAQVPEERTSPFAVLRKPEADKE